MAALSLAQRVNGALRPIPAWPIYLLGALWAGWLFLRAIKGEFVDPVVELERRSGLLALQLLVAGLCITPLRDLTRINLVKYRRAIGLTAFFLVLYHLTVWAVLDLQALGRVLADLMKRPYITVGMAALVLLIPLALTSNDRSIRKLGPILWRRIHWLTYPAAVLAAVHFSLQPKTWDPEPLFYLSAIAVLLLWRLARYLRRRKPGDSRRVAP